MAKFHGPKNLHLGVETDEKTGLPTEGWAHAEYDPESHDYVIDVSGDDLKKFRAVADEYGFVEDKAAEKSAAKASQDD